MHYNYLIIGGGIAGITAAETIRENDCESSIAVISQEPHLLYSRVLLPSYIKKRVRRDQVFLRTVDDFEKKNIVPLLGKEVALVRSEKKEVRVKSGEVYSFDKLLIATGGTPRSLGIPGENIPGAFRLQTVDDADKILEYLPGVKKAVVIGGGFISLEFLEILHVYKISTTLIVRGPHFFGDILDSAGAELMAKNFERYGIDTLVNDEAVEFVGRERILGVRTKGGRVLKCDFVGAGIGLKRNDDFVLGTDLIAVAGQGIRTNEFLEAAISGIFAAGDIADYFDVITGRYYSHGNWTNAFLQGRMAGRNMAGQEAVPFKVVPFYSITNLGLHITFLGEAEDAEGVEMISRIDSVGNRYERFFLQENALVGAILINMFHDKPTTTRLIEEKTPISSYREKLYSMDFDLNTIFDGPSE